MSEPTEMLERVAIGLITRAPVPLSPSVALDLARAAIRAMLEPTKEMIAVGNPAIDDNIESWNYDSDSGFAVGAAAAHCCWEAMISSALGEE